MAEHVDCCIMEAVHERLRIPTRMKGGGVRRVEDTRYLAFLGAWLDVLPRCIDRTEANGECVSGYYAYQLT